MCIKDGGVFYNLVFVVYSAIVAPMVRTWQTMLVRCLSHIFINLSNPFINLLGNLCFNIFRSNRNTELLLNSFVNWGGNRKKGP